MMADLFYNHSKANGQKLIDFNNGMLALNEDGIKVLSKMDPEKKANLMFIFGNARSGKSFMMNCLAGTRGLFQVINSSIPCTKGVDISNFTNPHKNLAAHVNGYSDVKVTGKDDTLCGFVDVEGQGDKDGTYDTILALPLLVTSKVVLFNHKGAPTVSDMLSKLGVLARAAEYIDLGDDLDGERRSTATSPASRRDSTPRRLSISKKNDDDDDDATTEMTSKSSGPKKFGHLHVLFRDFSFDGAVEEVYDQLLKKEKIPKKKVGKTGATDPAKAAKERNDIRDLLGNNFESINVWLFKQPASADELREHKELPVELIDPEFTATIRKLLAMVTQQMSEPTLFNGKPMTGPKLAALIRQVSSQLNEGGAINVPSVFRAMEKETVMRVGAEKLAEFKKMVAEVSKKFPMSANALQETLDGLAKACLSNFDEDLRDCVLQDEIKETRTKLEAACAKDIEDAVRTNKDAVLAKIKDVVGHLMQELRNDFESFCKDNMPLQDSKQLDVKFLALKKAAIAKIHKELAMLEGASQMKEFQVLVIESEESLQEFLQLKATQNENELKENTINKLREEAIAQQKRLIEQNEKLEKYIAEEKSNTIKLGEELERMKKEKADEEKRTQEMKKIMQQREAELETLRKNKRKGCTIL